MTDLEKIADAICWLTKPTDRHETHLVNALYAIAGDGGPPSIRHSLDRIADAIFELAEAVQSASLVDARPADTAAGTDNA